MTVKAKRVLREMEDGGVEEVERMKGSKRGRYFPCSSHSLKQRGEVTDVAITGKLCHITYTQRNTHIHSHDHFKACNHPVRR